MHEPACVEVIAPLPHLRQAFEACYADFTAGYGLLKSLGTGERT